MVRRTRSHEVPGARSPSQTEGVPRRRRSRDESGLGLLTAWRVARKRVAAMRGDLSCYASVQVDRARLATSQAIAGVVSTTILILVLTGVVIAAATLTMVGAAGGVAAGLGGNVWLANLITGLGTLILFGVASTIIIWLNRRKRIDRLTRKYARYELQRRAGNEAKSPEGKSDAK